MRMRPSSTAVDFHARSNDTGSRLVSAVFVLLGENSMLNVTDQAAARLSEILEDHPIDSVIRIFRKDGRMKMRLTSAQPNDEKFDHQGRVVLVLAKRVSAHFAGGTLDLRDANRGPKLYIRRRSVRRPR